MSFCVELGRNFVNIVRSENFNKKRVKSKDKVNILYTYDTTFSGCSAIIPEIVNRYVHVLSCLKKETF